MRTPLRPFPTLTQVHQYGARHVAAASGFIEVDVDALQLQVGVAGVGAWWMNVGGRGIPARWGVRERAAPGRKRKKIDTGGSAQRPPSSRPVLVATPRRSPRPAFAGRSEGSGGGAGAGKINEQQPPSQATSTRKNEKEKGKRTVAGHAMLLGDDLPELGANLVAALTSLDVDLGADGRWRWAWWRCESSEGGWAQGGEERAGRKWRRIARDVKEKPMRRGRARAGGLLPP